MVFDPNELVPFATLGGSGGALFGLVRILGKVAEARGWFGINGHAAPASDASLSVSMAKLSVTLENVDRTMQSISTCQEDVTRVQAKMLDRIEREIVPTLDKMGKKIDDIESEQSEIGRSLYALTNRRPL